MPFSKQIIEQVWSHARVMTDLSPEVWRKDECGAWIRREHFEQEDSEFGWRIVNVSLGGQESAENLRPLHVANRYERAQGRAHCAITADQTQQPGTARVREPRNRRL